VDERDVFYFYAFVVSDYQNYELTYEEQSVVQ